MTQRLWFAKYFVVNFCACLVVLGSCLWADFRWTEAASDAPARYPRTPVSRSFPRETCGFSGRSRGEGTCNGNDWHDEICAQEVIMKRSSWEVSLSRFVTNVSVDICKTARSTFLKVVFLECPWKTTELLFGWVFRYSAQFRNGGRFVSIFLNPHPIVIAIFFNYSFLFLLNAILIEIPKH